MTTESERKEFLDRIVRDPADDTVRLVYADWLDEQPKSKVCPDCVGGWVRSPCEVCGNTPDDGGWLEHGRGCYVLSADGGGGESADHCPRCDGTGTVPDTADADRAEFIRHQCATVTALFSERHRRREAELLAAHPEWRRLPCPECKGKGRIARRGAGGQSDAALNPLCPTCGGTGDLFARPEYDSERANPHVVVSRTVTFSRGFPGSVTCALRELGGERAEHRTRFSDSSLYDEVCIHCGATNAAGSLSLHEPCVRRFVPSPWAEAVTRHSPATRFVLTDLGPFADEGLNVFAWFPPLPLSYPPSHPFAWRAPLSLFQELKGFRTDYHSAWGHAKIYCTRTAALDALALACGRVVRRAVYGGAG